MKPGPVLSALLRDGLDASGLPADAATVARFVTLLTLLEKWSGAYNLTAVREPERMVALHILDSLSVLPDLRGRRVLDIGTGAGFPGLPLALLAPGRDFVLLDASAKKLRFVRQAALELGLDNVVTVHSRAEDYAPDSGFDTVVARAFASLGAYAAVAAPLVAPGGRIVAMRGRAPGHPEPPPRGRWRSHVRRVSVPTLEQERHVVVFEHDAAATD